MMLRFSPAVTRMDRLQMSRGAAKEQFGGKVREGEVQMV